MNKYYFYALAAGFLFAYQPMKAEQPDTNPNDTIKTYNVDEIVITSSTKETNNLTAFPGSYTVISPQAVAGRQIESLKNLSAFVPNLYMPDYGAKLTSAIYIRGIGARSSGQSIGLYVDNMPYLDKSSFDFELTDIQRIEVLRGPQGTLYGRNAMGGIINIYTQSPFTYQGTKISVGGGNYGHFHAKASHFNKLSEKVSLSLSAYYDRNDGFFTNEYNGKKVDNEESAGGRLKLDWRIHPALTLAYSFSFDYTGQGAFPYGKYNTETGKTEPVNFNDPSSYTRTMLANNLLLEYKTDRFTVSSTTGFQYLDDDMIMDQDYEPLSIFTLNQKQKQKAFSEEIALKSTTRSNYQWSAGLFGFYNSVKTEGPVDFKEDGVQGILQKVFDDLQESGVMPVTMQILDETIYIPSDFDTPSYGLTLFHQSTYNNFFTEGLLLTAGIRIDYEKQKIHYRSNGKMNMGVSMSPMMPVIDISGYYEESVIDRKLDQNFWQALPKVSLKYQCTPGTFSYITVAKGYKTGGYNVQMSADIMQSQMQYDIMQGVENFIEQNSRPGMSVNLPDFGEPQELEEAISYKPEHSWNYEFGVRSELVSNRLEAELTLFYMDVRDIQLTKFVNSGNGRILANACKAQSYGAEASLRAQLCQGLSADINYGYTHATFRDYIQEEKENGAIIETNYKGNYIPYTPRHTLSIGLQYSKLFRNKLIDQFIASAQFNGAGKIYWTERNDIVQNFYGTVNAKAGVRKGIVRVDAWSRNLTNTSYDAFYFESRTIPFIQKGKPFQVGADVTITF
ncbi:MAG: TonB-dependent receptor [Tannerellaceae bacterium]|nr:TonB-dependent receptor [Tannerellaceae bacterium]